MVTDSAAKQCATIGPSAATSWSSKYEHSWKTRIGWLTNTVDALPKRAMAPPHRTRSFALSANDQFAMWRYLMHPLEALCAPHTAVSPLVTP
jgi:hypothetical protein